MRYSVPMKLPVFEEVKTSDFSVSALEKLLHQTGAGKTPLCIHLDATEPQSALEQANNIAKALTQLGIHPQLPFPCYLISPVLQGHSELPVVALEQDLPSHFRKKTKRLKNKEQSILNRVRLVADKLNNQNLPQLDEGLKLEMKEHRKLYKLTRETHFLELLLKRLK